MQESEKNTLASKHTQSMLSDSFKQGRRCLFSYASLSFIKPRRFIMYLYVVLKNILAEKCMHTYPFNHQFIGKRPPTNKNQTIILFLLNDYCLHACIFESQTDMVRSKERQALGFNMFTFSEQKDDIELPFSFLSVAMNSVKNSMSSNIMHI